MNITLVPTAGLCNRINMILCAINAFEECHFPMKIYWEKTEDCKAEFAELFKPLNYKELKVYPLRKFYLQPGGKRNFFIPDLLKRLYFDVCYNGGEIANKSLEESCMGFNRIYITAHNRFCNVSVNNHNVGDLFRPTDEIDQRISTITSKYTVNTVGIHIRQTDNVAAIKNNPIEKFTSFMDKELSLFPETTFYVASDSQEVKDMLIKRYKSLIIPTSWNLNRNSVEGMKDAVADLYCLGRTSKIIGCTNSTYSLIASILYQKKLIL